MYTHTFPSFFLCFIPVKGTVVAHGYTLLVQLFFFAALQQCAADPLTRVHAGFLLMVHRKHVDESGAACPEPSIKPEHRLPSSDIWTRTAIHGTRDQVRFQVEVCKGTADSNVETTKTARVRAYTHIYRATEAIISNEV